MAIIFLSTSVSFNLPSSFFVGQGMQKEGRKLDHKRIFYSDVTDDNELHVIVGKVTIVRMASKGKSDKSPAKTPECDYYFDKGYKFAYATFYELPKDLPG